MELRGPWLQIECAEVVLLVGAEGNALYTASRSRFRLSRDRAYGITWRNPVSEPLQKIAALVSSVALVHLWGCGDARLDFAPGEVEFLSLTGRRWLKVGKLSCRLDS